MTRFILCLAAFLITAWSPDAGAQDYQATLTTNALNDLARAQRDQAESLRRLETIQRDRARAADTVRHNAERDARSLRRFDR